MNPAQFEIHLPFSYYLSHDKQRNVPLMKPNASLVSAYCKALEGEITSLGADLQGPHVASVAFHGGYLSLLSADQFASLIQCVKRSFHVADGAGIRGTLFPGSLDLALISEYKNYGVEPLMFEVPTLLPRECQPCQVPNVLQALDQTKYFLDNMQFPSYGFRIPADLTARDAEAWRAFAGQILHYSPLLLQFTGLETMDETSDWPAFRGKLEEMGFTEADQGMWHRLEKPYAFMAETKKERERISVGLSAESIIDGYWTKNTDSMDHYLKQCSNYRNLIVQAKELSYN